jgi:hypothetical protein
MEDYSPHILAAKESLSPPLTRGWFVVDGQALGAALATARGWGRRGLGLRLDGHSARNIAEHRESAREKLRDSQGKWGESGWLHVVDYNKVKEDRVRGTWITHAFSIIAQEAGRLSEPPRHDKGKTSPSAAKKR